MPHLFDDFCRVVKLEDAITKVTYTLSLSTVAANADVSGNIGPKTLSGYTPLGIIGIKTEAKLNNAATSKLVVSSAELVTSGNSNFTIQLRYLNAGSTQLTNGKISVTVLFIKTVEA